MPGKFSLFFIALLFSSLNNLLIPYAIYFQKFGFFKKRPAGFIGVNHWGIIMDGFLAGLINITALNLLLEMKLGVMAEDIKIALLAGLCLMAVTHFLMATRRWRIWIMPSPWHWNLAGYWHMISMTLQMAFLFYPLILLLKNPLLWEKAITKNSLELVLFLALLFLAALHAFDQRQELKIGRIKISNTPW